MTSVADHSSRFSRAMAEDITIPEPDLVLDLLVGFRRSKAMFAAVSLGVFDVLAGGPRLTETLADQLKVPRGALERLLDACVALGLLMKDDRSYANTPEAATYLTRNSPRRLTGYISYSNDVLWSLWANLESAVREGTPRWNQTFDWNEPLFSSFFHSEESKREFLIGMHGMGLLSSPRVVAAFELSGFRRIVDLGGATGHLAMAACQRYPNLTAVVFDLPEVVPLARAFIEASPVADRVVVEAGDFFADRLPAGDLYALGRILHDWGEDKILNLLSRVVAALPAGGGILIAEKLLSEDKSGPEFAHLQDLNMLTCTEGKERTLKEYEALLLRVGLVDVRGSRTSSPLDAVIARKP
jgi:acetylserotonin N-methyltransferase